MAKFTREEALKLLDLEGVHKKDMALEDLTLAYRAGRDRDHHLGAFGVYPDHSVFYAHKGNIRKYLQESGWGADEEGLVVI